MKNVSPHAISGASLPASGRTTSTPANVSAMYRVIEASSIGPPAALRWYVRPANAEVLSGLAHRMPLGAGLQGPDTTARRYDLLKAPRGEGNCCNPAADSPQ